MNLEKEWQITTNYSEFLKKSTDAEKPFFSISNFKEIFTKYVNKNEVTDIFRNMLQSSQKLKSLRFLNREIDLFFELNMWKIFIFLQDSYLFNYWINKTDSIVIDNFATILIYGSCPVKEAKNLVHNLIENIIIKIEREYLKIVLPKYTVMNVKDLNNIIVDYL